MARFKRITQLYNRKNEEGFNYANAAFLAVMVIILVFCFVFAIISPNNVLEYENRAAKKLSDADIKKFSTGEFQDEFEEAVSDQVIFAGEIKEKYNLSQSSFINNCLKIISKNDVLPDEDDQREIAIDDTSDIGGSEIDTSDSSGNEQNTSTGAAIEIVTTNEAITKEENVQEKTEPIATKAAVQTEKGEATGGKYYSVGSGLYLFNDWVVQGLASFTANQPRVDKYVARFNELAEAYPEINFYLYYIERDSDQNYASGSRSGISDYIKETAQLPDGHVGIQRITSFAEYKVYNYKSDHHWNYKGSYAGYKDILKMIKPEADPLIPVGEYLLGYTKGSFTKTDATANVTDDFYAYEFDFPGMRYWFNGKETSDYGNQEQYIENAKAGNNNQSLKYASFYGGDVGEIAIYNGSGEGCLLIFGNSYDNAVVKLLASHYERTYCVDLRYYKSQSGVSFSFAKFLETHPVTDVLGLGNAYYFMQSPFIISK